MKAGVIRARIEPHLKAQASEVLSSCGLEMSEAIRLFLHQVVAADGLPFKVSRPVRIRQAGARQLAASKQAAQARDHRLAARGALSSDDVLLVPAKHLRKAQIKWPSLKRRG